MSYRFYITNFAELPAVLLLVFCLGGSGWMDGLLGVAGCVGVRLWGWFVGVGGCH